MPKKALKIMLTKAIIVCIILSAKMHSGQLFTTFGLNVRLKTLRDHVSPTSKSSNIAHDLSYFLKKRIFAH
jgi:hypothetical protein